MRAGVALASGCPEYGSVAGCTILCRDARQRTLHEPHARGVVGVDLSERLGQVRGQARGEPRARHGMPLVANAAGVEHERPRPRNGGGEARLGDGHEARLAVRGEEAAIPEQALSRSFSGATGPLKRRQLVERLSAEAGSAGDVEGAAAAVLEAGEARMLL